MADIAESIQDGIATITLNRPESLNSLSQELLNMLREAIMRLGSDSNVGAIIITGDYKFDHTPIDGRITDVNRFAQLGQEGVLALLADSTNAETPGSTASESIVGMAGSQKREKSKACCQCCRKVNREK